MTRGLARLLFLAVLGFPFASPTFAASPPSDLPSCRKAQPPDRKNCRKDWTILVYMAADNDLMKYALLDLYEMEAGYESGELRAGSTAKTDLLVQLDSEGNYGARRIHVFQSKRPYVSPDPKLFEARSENDIESPVVQELPESNSADPAELENFLSWGMSEYPARHYMVVVWGHGFGLSGSQQGFGSIARDNLSDSQLDVSDLAHVLRNVSAQAGQPIDVFATDACLMQSIETATEITGAARDGTLSARFVVGSTDIFSHAGLPYRRILHEINSGRFLSERARTRSNDEAWLLARIIPTLTADSFAPRTGLQAAIDPKALTTLTLSALSADELRLSLIPALDSVARALVDSLDDDPSKLIDFAQSLATLPAYLGGTRDVGGFLQGIDQALMVPDSDEARRSPSDLSPVEQHLRQAILEAQSALDRSIVSYVFGARAVNLGLGTLGFKALAAWLPDSSEQYQSQKIRFQKSDFWNYGQGPAGQPGPWSKFLDELYGT